MSSRPRKARPLSEPRPRRPHSAPTLHRPSTNELAFLRSDIGQNVIAKGDKIFKGSGGAIMTVEWGNLLRTSNDFVGVVATVQERPKGWVTLADGVTKFQNPSIAPPWGVVTASSPDSRHSHEQAPALRTSSVASSPSSPSAARGRGPLTTNAPVHRRINALADPGSAVRSRILQRGF